MTFDPAKLKHFDQATDAAAFVAQEAAHACHEAIRKRGKFHWVLAGGGTPELCYRLLRDQVLPWDKIHVWFGDERALKKGHADRNETMARKALLDTVPIPKHQIHSIDFTNGTTAAATAYIKEMKQVATFDFVMLGMGEDGHTASLFPKHESLKNNALAVPEFNSPKAPKERVSMGLKALNNHHDCFILATGSSKREVLQAIHHGADLPVTQIQNVTWVVDQAAWEK